MKIGLSGPPGARKTETARELHYRAGLFPVWFDVLEEFGPDPENKRQKDIFDERIGQEEAEVDQVVYVGTASDAIAYGAQLLYGKPRLAFIEYCVSHCPSLDYVFVLDGPSYEEGIVTTNLCLFAAYGFYGDAFVQHVVGKGRAGIILKTLERLGKDDDFD